MEISKIEQPCFGRQRKHNGVIKIWSTMHNAGMRKTSRKEDSIQNKIQRISNTVQKRKVGRDQSSPICLSVLQQHKPQVLDRAKYPDRALGDFRTVVSGPKIRVLAQNNENNIVDSLLWL